MHHPGTKWKFNYPRQFVSLPEYTAHAGQTVEIVRALREGLSTMTRPSCWAKDMAAMPCSRCVHRTVGLGMRGHLNWSRHEDLKILRRERGL